MTATDNKLDHDAKLSGDISPPTLLRPIPAETAQMAEYVRTALAEDALCRRAHVTGGLYPIEDGAGFQRIGCEYPNPIIRSSRYSRDRFELATSNAAFAARLSLLAPWVADFDLAANGLILAGGAASATMTTCVTDGHEDYWFHDFDLFLVGHQSDSAALAAIHALADHLHVVWRGAVNVFRTMGCVTFVRRREVADVRSLRYAADNAGTPMPIVQVILQRYNSKAEVLHSFDLGSSAVLWDGKQVQMTALGKIAIYRGANVVNLAARYPSFEPRIARYFDRGFDIVLTGISAGALRHTRPPTDPGAYWWSHCATYKFPYMSVARNSSYCCASCIGAARIEPRAIASATAAASSYQHALIHYDQTDKILLRNAQACAGAVVKPEQLCAYARYSPGSDVSSMDASFDHDDDFMRAVSATTESDNSIRFGDLRTLLGPAAAAAYMAQHCAAGRGLKWSERVAFVLDRLRALKAYDLSIPFCCNPISADLAGRFPRETVSAKQWYGAYADSYAGL
jgi:hypothetical protein